MKNIFDKTVSDEVIGRIHQLTTATGPVWGKMTVSQMLAHCNVTYEMVYENIHKKPNFLMGFLMRSFIKNTVVNEKPYKKNSPTGPGFLIKNEKDFDNEKARLIAYITRTQQKGGADFHNKESLSFGKLTTTEWNNMFYKHLHHHLTQFGV